MMDVGSSEGIRGSNKVPLLCNLKHPTLSCLNASRGPFGMLRCYHLVASLAKASPFLHRLKLRLSLYSTENSPHKYLEVLVSGFSGNKLNTDFACLFLTLSLNSKRLR
uniref:Uncharacterized protein n=2 Tax=Gossypium raimondii TaxID=29730 RepID=A0A0D2V8C3_GOSRA|nr:hypothetical protein B456_010G101500 [Gossypium raimondii]